MAQAFGVVVWIRPTLGPRTNVRHMLLFTCVRHRGRDRCDQASDANDEIESGGGIGAE
jgi:hypothetical protein